MARKELGGRDERPPKKETEKKPEVIDRPRLEQIVTNSLGTAILSDVSYDKIFGDHGEKFKPFKFDSPNTVRVKTPDGIQEWLEDGHHRSKGFLDHYDTIMTAHPDFEFTIRDSTNDFLEDLGAGKDKLEALTIVQYFNVVAEATKSQADVSEKRSAAYIIRAWETICGKELAEKFSALHGFNLLASDERQKKFKGDLKEFLQTQPEIIEGETKEERARAEAALHTMHDFIKKIDLSAKEVSEEAFMLIGTRADVIGGEEAAQKQIKGLLSLPAVKKKIQENGHDADPEIQAADLQSKLVQAMTEPAPTKVVKEIKAIQAALVDPEVSLSDVHDLLNSKKSAANAYEDLQKKKHKAALIAKFQEKYPAIEITGIVSTMLGRDSAHESYFEYIKAAGKIMNEARVAVAAGVKSADLDKAIRNLQHAPIYHLSNATRTVRLELDRLRTTPEEPTTEEETPPETKVEVAPIKPKKKVAAEAERQILNLTAERDRLVDTNKELMERVRQLEERNISLAASLHKATITINELKAQLPQKDMEIRGKEDRTQGIVFHAKEKPRYADVELSSMPDLIDSAAQSILPELTPQWDTILTYVPGIAADGKKMQGKEALGGPLAERMLDIMQHLNWSPEDPAFKSLSARHIILSLSVNPTHDENDQKRDEYISIAKKNLRKYNDEHNLSVQERAVHEFALYTHKDDSTRKTVLEQVGIDADLAHARVERYKKENGDIEQLFGVRMIGRRGRI